MATSTARKPRATGTAKSATARKTTSTKPVARKTEGMLRPEPVVVQTAPCTVSAPELKKKELIDLVVERSGIKKREVKPAVEAALAILGDALAAGRDLNLAPLGKIKVTKQKRVARGTVLTTRVRQNDDAGKDMPEPDVPDPLAHAAE